MKLDDICLDKAIDAIVAVQPSELQSLTSHIELDCNNCPSHWSGKPRKIKLVKMASSQQNKQTNNKHYTVETR